MTALRDRRGRVEGYLKVMRDATERREQEEKLRVLNETLEQRVRDRTEELLVSQERLRGLVLELASAEQRERQRIATDLHDKVAQQLAVCTMRLGPARANAPPDLRAPLEGTWSCLDQTMKDVRALMYGLSPLVLDESDLGGAIEWAAEPVKGLGVRVRLDERAPRVRLGRELLAMLASSIRELLHNVLKHAKAQSASVEARKRGRSIRITVRDDGIGFDPAALTRPGASGGFGLFNIRERLAAMGGDVEIVSSATSGTTVTLVVPAPAPAPARARARARNSNGRKR